MFDHGPLDYRHYFVFYIDYLFYIVYNICTVKAPACPENVLQ